MNWFRWFGKENPHDAMAKSLYEVFVEKQSTSDAFLGGERVPSTLREIGYEETNAVTLALFANAWMGTYITVSKALIEVCGS